MLVSKSGLKIGALAILLALGACQTIPYAQRAANFETKMRTDFIGKSKDNIVLAFGVPHSSYMLTDGREVAQYFEEKTYTTGGGTYTDYEYVVVGTRSVEQKDGSVKQVPITRAIPYLRTDPITTHHQECTRRFVIGKDKNIEDFKWQGNSCF
jgi:hypothetical protein